MLKFILGTLVTFFSAYCFAHVTEEYVRNNAVQINSNDLALVIDSIAKSKVVTIGEMHGSQDIPQFTLDLFSQLRLLKKKIILGIEVPEEDQALVGRFVHSKDLSILKNSKFFVRSLQDGRSSEAMVKLLEGLPKDAVVVCFDSPNASSGQERDKQMAENLIKAYKKLKPSLFVVLAGNVHSAIEVGTPFDPNYKPMGYFLHSLPKSPIKLNDLRAIRVRYAGGDIWACMGTRESDCKIHQMNPPLSPYSSAVTYDRY